MRVAMSYTAGRHNQQFHSRPALARALVVLVFACTLLAVAWFGPRLLFPPASAGAYADYEHEMRVNVAILCQPADVADAFAAVDKIRELAKDRSFSRLPQGLQEAARYVKGERADLICE